MSLRDVAAADEADVDGHAIQWVVQRINDTPR
jgi:hypothetical protein